MAASITERRFTFDNVPESKTIRRIVEKKIHRWIRSRFSAETSGQFSYRAVFRKEGEKSVICCYLEIGFGKRLWRASWYARNLHQALQQCLGHLTPTT